MLSKNDLTEGTVISTDFQTAGRGQHNKSWNVTAGENITMSIILKPTWLALKDQFALNVIASLAVYEALSKYAEGVTIKWPNDIYIHDKKVAGILIKNQLQGTTIRNSIMGLGLNINQLEWPHDVPNATSLAAIGGKKYDLSGVKKEVFKCLEEVYKAYKNDSYEGWKRYRSLIYKKKKSSDFLINNHLKKGVITDVADNGELLILSLIHISEPTRPY